MSRYYLSETYASIYNPRLQESSDDNLRFIDYMLDEDIEEVVESLFWEFRDYGETEQTAFELLEGVISDEIIDESVELIHEKLSPRQKEERRKFKKKQAAERAAENAMYDAKIRRDKRKARVDGAISRVKAAWKGAIGGMGKAKAAISGGLGKAANYVNAQRKEGQAKLKRLMRTGADAVKNNKLVRATSAAGRAFGYEMSGKAAETSRQAKVKRDFRKTVRAARARDTSSFNAPKKAEPTSSERKYPSEPSGQTTMFTGPVRGKSAGIDVKVPSGGQRRFGAKPKPKGGKRQLPLQLKKAGYNEELMNTIVNDLIEENYANTYDEALDILDSLSDEAFEEIVETYLED